MRWPFLVQYCTILSSLASFCAARPNQGTVTFKTEPKFKTAKFTIETVTEDRSLLSPGYIFIDPFGGSELWGPQIFDQDGVLIWCGNRQRLPERRRVQGFRACDYLGENGTHLCWHERTRDHIGTNRVFSNKYEQVGKEHRRVGTMKDAYSLNSHEYKMLPGGYSFLQAVTVKETRDLRPYTGPEEGIVLNGCFQEVSVEDEELFHWCLLDYIPEWHTDVFLKENYVNKTNHLAGYGTNKKPWDLIHLNAVDKNSDGDYIVSARHFDQVMKIAGNNNSRGIAPGEILWRLGGKHSDIQYDDEVSFTRQHDVSFVETKGNIEVISLFDNAFDGDNASKDKSVAKVIEVDEIAKKATLKHSYPHPENKRSAYQGSVQVLPNGNVLVGWTLPAQLTEFTENGTILYHAHIDQGVADTNYRTPKLPWVGFPQQAPKALGYCKSCQFTPETPLIAYVSWNGATAVSSWRFSIKLNLKGGEWVDAGTFVKTGFETKVTLPKTGSPAAERGFTFARQMKAEALDVNGEILRSTETEIFVPDGLMGNWNCDNEGCEAGFGYEWANNASWRCNRDMRISVMISFLAVVALEFVSFYWERRFFEYQLRT